MLTFVYLEGAADSRCHEPGEETSKKEGCPVTGGRTMTVPLPPLTLPYVLEISCNYFYVMLLKQSFLVILL